MKIYVLSDPAVDARGVAVPVVAWETICRDRTTKLIVHHEPIRWTSRWVAAARRRPYGIYCVRRGRWNAPLSYHATLMAAVRAATRLSKELRDA
jgi:hypothetical protein